MLYEATRDSAALGAVEILAWAQRNSEHVRTVSTQVFFNYVQARETNLGHREKDLGERAAIEAIHDGISLAVGERAVLITEDDRVLRRVLVVEAELTSLMIPITMRDFLLGMEAARKINSAEEVYRRAEEAGRFASRRTILADQHARARDAVERVLRRP